MSNNVLESTYNAFYAHGFKTWDKNEIRIEVGLRDGYNGAVEQYFTEEQAVKIIDILETALAEARNTPDHVEDENDTLF